MKARTPLVAAIDISMNINEVTFIKAHLTPYLIDAYVIIRGERCFGYEVI
jgi:hypothetical protein